jgi:hypothetical protein
MHTNSARILCIGKDPGLLRSRCAVLGHGGYDAQYVMYPDAERLLTREAFDLIILSAILSQEEKDHIWTIVGDTPPVLTLKKLVFASELLRDVERRLGKVRQTA